MESSNNEKTRRDTRKSRLGSAAYLSSDSQDYSSTKTSINWCDANEEFPLSPFLPCAAPQRETNKNIKDNATQWSPGRLHGGQSQTKKSSRKQEYNEYETSTLNRFSILEQNKPDEQISTSIQSTSYAAKASNNKVNRQIKNHENNRHTTVEFPPLPTMAHSNIHKFLKISVANGIRNRERMFQELKKKTNLSREDITEIRDGSLLIKSRSPKITEDILNLKNIANSEVTTSINVRLSQARCTIYAKSLLSHTESELQEDFADRGVVEVKRFKKRVNGELEDTPIHLLTFDNLNPPSYIYHGWVKYSTRRYIPQPRQCYKCFKFGHISIGCRSTVQLCATCSQDGHENSQCRNQVKCLHCGENHKPTSKQCAIYKLHHRTQTIKELEQLSHREALIKAKQEMGVTTTTYSNVVKSGPSKPITRSQQQIHPQEQQDTRKHKGNIPPKKVTRSYTPPPPLMSVRTEPPEAKDRLIPGPAEAILPSPQNSAKSKGKKMKRVHREPEELLSSDELPSPTRRKIPTKTTSMSMEHSPSKHDSATETLADPKNPHQQDSTTNTTTATVGEREETVSPPVDDVEHNLAILHGETIEAEPIKPKSIIHDLPWPPGFCPQSGGKEDPGPSVEPQGRPIEVINSKYTHGAQTPTPQAPRDPRIYKPHS